MNNSSPAPSVSVIIPTHSRPHMLPRAVESAREAGTNVEIVVVDDASTDETAAVCRSLKDIKYIRLERNERVAGARNAGILASSGTYISFLDDDDLRLPSSLDMQVEALEAEPKAMMIYGQALLANQSGNQTGRLYPLNCLQGDIFWELLGQNFVPCGSVVFRRDCLPRTGMLETGVPGIDDWDLWIRIAELFTVIALAQPAIIWRQSTPASAQGTSAAAHLVSISARQFRERWMKLARASQATKKMRREAWRRFSNHMARHLLWEAARALMSGRPSQTAHNLFVALRLFPVEVVRVLCSRTNVRASFLELQNRRRVAEGAYPLEERSGSSE